MIFSFLSVRKEGAFPKKKVAQGNKLKALFEKSPPCGKVVVVDTVVDVMSVQ